MKLCALCKNLKIDDKDMFCNCYKIDIEPSPKGFLVRPIFCKKYKKQSEKTAKSDYKKKLKMLQKKADALWSLCVRTRDKRCTLCGKTETLQAHHFIRTKGACSKHRYTLINGITLCYACHLYKVHADAALVHIQPLGQSLIARGHATEDEINNILHDKAERVIESIEYYEGIIENLEGYLKCLKLGLPI
jgi:hypothetical protein